MPVLINPDKIAAMVKDWQAQAAARALPLKKLRERLAAGGTFTAAEVQSSLALVSAFYTIEGRVKALEDLLRDLGSAPGLPSITPPPEAWRLP